MINPFDFFSKKNIYDKDFHLHSNKIMQVIAGITRLGIPTLKIMYADNVIDKIRYTKENVKKIEESGFPRQEIQYMLVGKAATDKDYDYLKQQGLTFDEIDYLLRKWRFENHIHYSIDDPVLSVPFSKPESFKQEGSLTEKSSVEKPKSKLINGWSVSKVVLFASVPTVLCGGYFLTKDNDFLKSENYVSTDYTIPFTNPSSSALESQVDELLYQSSNDTIYYSSSTVLDGLDGLASKWLDLSKQDLSVSTVSDIAFLLNYSNASEQQYYLNKYAGKDISTSIHTFSERIYQNTMNGNVLDLSSLANGSSTKEILSDFYNRLSFIENAKKSQSSSKVEMEDFISNYILNYYQANQNHDVELLTVLQLYQKNVMELNSNELDFDRILSTIEKQMPIKENYDVLFQEIMESLEMISSQNEQSKSR